MKAVIFDLDGVLIDAKDIHYRCLNEALGPEYAISYEDHRNIYDGHKTQDKLEMLTERVGLPRELHSSINAKKQKLTEIALKTELKPKQHIIDLMEELKRQGYQISICSNSISATLWTAVELTGLKKYISWGYSNCSVDKSKPYPYLYWACMMKMGVLPDNTWIIEDSPPGLLAANRSGANVIRVTSPEDVTIDNIIPKLGQKEKKIMWSSEKLNVLIPMAGAGTRFSQAGYTFPKPLIDVKGKPMIQVVVENLNIDANYIYVVQKEHRERFHLDNMLPLISPDGNDCKVVEVDELTQGAACTALLAKEYINNDDPLFFANSDQWVDWDPVQFMYDMQESDADGGIVIFKSTHPKWSFAAVSPKTGLVTEVAEKNPISDCATVGFYYWKHGSDFVKYAEQMIEDDVRVNGEFYVCPVFNHAIKDGKRVKTSIAKGMWGLGTPEDLEIFIREKELPV